jgi:hypothetical protein
VVVGEARIKSAGIAVSVSRILQVREADPKVSSIPRKRVDPASRVAEWILESNKLKEKWRVVLR